MLRRWPVVLPIPGTKSLAHLEENCAAGAVVLDEATYSGAWTRWPPPERRDVGRGTLSSVSTVVGRGVCLALAGLLLTGCSVSTTDKPGYQAANPLDPTPTARSGAPADERVDFLRFRTLWIAYHG